MPTRTLEFVVTSMFAAVAYPSSGAEAMPPVGDVIVITSGRGVADGLRRSITAECKLETADPATLKRTVHRYGEGVVTYVEHPDDFVTVSGPKGQTSYGVDDPLTRAMAPLGRLQSDDVSCAGYEITWSAEILDSTPEASIRYRRATARFDLAGKLLKPVAIDEGDLADSLAYLRAESTYDLRQSPRPALPQSRPAAPD